MKLSFEYKGIKVTYYLTYKKAKAISINITEDGVVNVVAPRGTTVFSVMDKVKGNAPWIISELYAKQPAPVEPTVELLEHYTYLGKNYKLELNVNTEAEVPKAKMVRGRLVVETASDEPKIVRDAIAEWYGQKVSQKIKERLKAFEQHFENVPKDLEIVDEHNTLFRAGAKGLIANVRLGILPIDVIDYIIVSGLCRINNAPEREQEQLEAILPDYAKSKQWLEENKSKLVL